MKQPALLVVSLALCLACGSGLPNFKTVYDRAEALTSARVKGVDPAELESLTDALQAEVEASKDKATTPREREFVREVEALLKIYRDGLSVEAQRAEVTVEGETLEVIPGNQETRAIFSEYGVSPKESAGTQFFDSTSTAQLWLAAIEQWGTVQAVYENKSP